LAQNFKGSKEGEGNGGKTLWKLPQNQWHVQFPGIANATEASLFIISQHHHAHTVDTKCFTVDSNLRRARKLLAGNCPQT
jgi:hypothetical protein